MVVFQQTRLLLYEILYYTSDDAKVKFITLHIIFYNVQIKRAVFQSSFKKSLFKTFTVQVFVLRPHFLFMKIQP